MRRREFRLVLRSGATVTIPLALVGYGLEKLTPAQLKRLELDNVGASLELREIEMDLSISGFIRDVFGFGDLQQHRAGRARSPKKAASSRANGAKGGRPRKVAAA